MRSLSTDDVAADSTSDRFRDHLCANESLVAVGSGTLVEPADQEAVSIGLTDRRLLSVAADGGFVDIGYDQINSIQSRPRQLIDSRGHDYRLLTAVGVVLALVAVGGIAVLTGGQLASSLALVTAGSVAATLVVRRPPVDVEHPALDTAVEAVDEFLRDVESMEVDTEWVPDTVDQQQLLSVGSSLLSVAAFVGVAAVAPLAVPFTLVAVSGVVLVDYAYRNRDRFDGIDVVRRQVREVNIYLVDGHAVHLRIDADEQIDRELSRCAAGATAPAAPTGLTPS